MSKSKKQQFTVTAGEFTAKKSEYDDEELDFVRGKKIEVKSGGGAGGGGTKSAGKSYSTSGSEYQHQTQFHGLKINNSSVYSPGWIAIFN
jgi:hypothetical protein